MPKIEIEIKKNRVHCNGSIYATIKFVIAHTN